MNNVNTIEICPLCNSPQEVIDGKVAPHLRSTWNSETGKFEKSECDGSNNQPAVLHYNYRSTTQM